MRTILECTEICYSTLKKHYIYTLEVADHVNNTDVSGFLHFKSAAPEAFKLRAQYTFDLRERV